MVAVTDLALAGMAYLAQLLYPVLPVPGLSYEDVAVSLGKALHSSVDSAGVWTRPGHLAHHHAHHALPMDLPPVPEDVHVGIRFPPESIVAATSKRCQLLGQGGCGRVIAADMPSTSSALPTPASAPKPASTAEGQQPGTLSNPENAGISCSGTLKQPPQQPAPLAGLPKRVAIKTALPSNSNRRSLMAEARALRLSAHPAIVKLHGSCWSDELDALVFELLPGGDLQDNQDPKLAKRVLQHTAHEKTLHLPPATADWPMASALSYADLALHCAAADRQQRPKAAQLAGALRELLDSFNSDFGCEDDMMSEDPHDNENDSSSSHHQPGLLQLLNAVAGHPLRSIALKHVPSSNRALLALARATQLTYLYMWRCEVQQRDFTSLAQKLTGLQRLTIGSEPGIKNAAVAAIGNNLGHLTRLSLSKIPITRASVPSVLKLRSLVRLSLPGNFAENRHVLQLSRLTNLTTLAFLPAYNGAGLDCEAYEMFDELRSKMPYCRVHNLCDTL
eukprot:gene9653-9813_t